MPTIGMSTGAVSRGNFAAAWSLLQSNVRAVEFSALREHELARLTSWLATQDLGSLDHVSIHAPSRRLHLSETALVEALSICLERSWPIVVHPALIETPALWRRFGRLLCLENMDKRSPGRTEPELTPFFDTLPEASFCLDLGHARQVDPTLGVARSLLRRFGGRLVQVHLSEVDSACRHRPLSVVTEWAVRSLAKLLPDVPVILESELRPDEVASELAMAARCFGPVPAEDTAPVIA